MPEHYLKVNNANICYEVDGAGPFIVFVPGGNGDAKLFRRFRDLLVKSFTVVLYDRRGYYRSQFTGPQGHFNQLTTDVDDLYRLMTHLTNEKFVIFGVSAGGSLLMKYIETYPETVLKCFAHEPLLYSETFEGRDKHLQEHRYIQELSKTEGRIPSIDMLCKKYFNALDRYIVMSRQHLEKINNWDYWLKYECEQYPFAKINWNTINAHKDILVLLYGIDSTGFFIAELVADIAKRLDKKALPLPGGHNGFYTHNKAFLTDFIELCKTHSLLPRSSPLEEPFVLLDQSKI